MKGICKYLALYVLGGCAYLVIELLWRGFTHWSMFFLGGLCFVLVGALNERLLKDMSLIMQGLTGAALITGLEFAAGYVLNIKLGLNVWDYSDMPLNILGQICPYYSALWFVLSIICTVTDDWIRYKFFGGEKVKYKIV